MPENVRLFRGLQRVLPVILAIALLAGCTSEDPDSIGMGLVHTEFEVELEPMEISNTTMYSAMEITDSAVPLDQQEVLYMGSQGGNSSSILVNFNFDDIYTDEFVDTLFTDEHILAVDMRLMVLNDYQSIGVGKDAHGGDKGLAKDFLVYQLEAPFDSTAFPGPEPAHLPNFINDITDPDTGLLYHVTLPVYKAYFLDWVNEGGLVGFMLEDGNRSEPGLVGYASRDMAHGGSTLDAEHEDVDLGVIFRVTFDNGSVLTMPSIADISTFHETSEIPTSSDDGFKMRTVLRSYPALRFDFSTLPENVFINRAILQVVNDTLTSFGHLDGVVVAEVDTVFFRNSSGEFPTWTLSELDDISTRFLGMGELGLDPEEHTVFQFNVTTSIQRIVNDANEGTMGFIFTGPENYITEYPALDPDIYFVEYNFHGTNDPDPDLRPVLKITYSTTDVFQEGGTP